MPKSPILMVSWCPTRQFRVARSRWMKCCWVRYSAPAATCLLTYSSCRSPSVDVGLGGSCRESSSDLTDNNSASGPYVLCTENCLRYNKYVRLRGRTYIHTCRSYVHTLRDFTNGASTGGSKGAGRGHAPPPSPRGQAPRMH